MGSVCGTQMVPIIKVDKGYYKNDIRRGKRKIDPMDTELDIKGSHDNDDNDKHHWAPPESMPMPKGIILTPELSREPIREPSQLTVEDNGARLSVATHTSGSDILSPSCSSMRSSTGGSFTSGHSVLLVDREKAPPRLLALSPGLHKLLMGKVEDFSNIQSRPRVIHLQVIAPLDDCCRERLSLWQHTFTPLRTMCAELGYTLDIQDDLWSPFGTRSPCLPFPKHFVNESFSWSTDDVEAVVVILTEELAYGLPESLSCEDVHLLVASIDSEGDSGLTSLFKSIYKKCQEGESSNCFLQRQALDQVDKHKVSKLVSLMVLAFQTSGMVTTCFHSAYYTKLKSVLSNPLLMGTRTVVVSRFFSHIMNFDATSGYNLDPSAACEDQEELARIKVAVEKGCDPSRRVKLELPHSDSKFHRERFEKDLNQIYLKEMGSSVREILWNVIESDITNRELKDRDIVTGVSRSLIDELVSQATFCHQLSQVEPLFYSTTELSLQEYIFNITEMPIVVYAPPGWGLSTMGAQLIDYCKTAVPKALLIYRFLGITPDTMTLKSTLLSIHQQLDTILGSRGHCQDDTHAFPSKSLLRDIVTRSTSHLPIIILLEGVTIASSKLKELEVMTLNESLPCTTRLIVMTNDVSVTRGLRLKMKDAFYVKAIPWEKQSIADLFSKATSDQMVVFPETQTTVIANAIKQCPLPLFAVTAAQLISFLYHCGRMFLELHEIPTSIDGIIDKFFDVLESYFPKNCIQTMLGYLCCSVGGIAPWEMNDLLSLNDFILQSVFSDEKEPSIYRAPTILWKSLFGILKPFLRVYTSINFYCNVLASSTLARHTRERYIPTTGISEYLHGEICDYFEGKWANTKKPYPVFEEEIDLLQNRYVMPQPTFYGNHHNSRKLLCLPHHTMISNSKSSHALEKFILNLSWIVHKLDGVSCLQVLLDLELAKRMAYSHAHPNDLDSLQAIFFLSSNALTVCGLEVYKILQQSVIFSAYNSKRENFKDSIYFVSSSYYKMIQFINKPPFPYLNPLDKESQSLPQLCPVPCPVINVIIPIQEKSDFVAILLKLEGEIRVVNWRTNTVVRTLKGLDHPSSLKMLDAITAVVLCNRELYVIDLDEGKIVKKLRTVLNFRIPFFGLQNKERLVTLSRDRMVVNVISLQTGGIISSFKAGETRFLDSLLLSKDGNIVVCGDATQKPYPLLVWSLEQGKLVHDIRMSQHEFITTLADITDDGHYIACGCREVSVTDSNFIVVYDLISGQLLKKFKMAAIATALAITSKSLYIVVALDTAQLAVWDINSGSRRLSIAGVHASIDKIVLSLDGCKCLTSCSKEYSISTHTLSLWDIEKGQLLGTHTFHAQISSVHLTWDGGMVLVGVRGHSNLIRLNLVSEGDNKTKKSGHKKQKTDGKIQEVFGKSLRQDTVINVSNA